MIFPRDKIQEMISTQTSIEGCEFIQHAKNGGDDDHGRSCYDLIFKYQDRYYKAEHFWAYDDPGSEPDFGDDPVFIHWQHWPLLNSNQVYCPEVKRKEKTITVYE